MRQERQIIPLVFCSEMCGNYIYLFFIVSKQLTKIISVYVTVILNLFISSAKKRKYDLLKRKRKTARPSACQVWIWSFIDGQRWMRNNTLYHYYRYKHRNYPTAVISEIFIQLYGGRYAIRRAVVCPNGDNTFTNIYIQQ